MEPSRMNLIPVINKIIDNRVRDTGIGNVTSSARNNPQNFLNIPILTVSLVRNMDTSKRDLEDPEGFGNYVDMGDYE